MQWAIYSSLSPLVSNCHSYHNVHSQKEKEKKTMFSLLLPLYIPGEPSNLVLIIKTERVYINGVIII